MFKKRKNAESDTQNLELKHEHKYKDFPWYIDAVWYPDRKWGRIKIVEPYVCIHCKNVLLKTLHDTEEYSKSTFESTISELKEKYSKYIEDPVVVMDMIYDYCLVDREYIKFAELFWNMRDSNINLQLPQTLTEKVNNT